MGFTRFALIVTFVAATQVLPVFMGPAWASGPVEWDTAPQQSMLSRMNDAQSGLRVLWWNIGKGISSQKQKAVLGYSPLDRNLQALPESSAGPDVLILGEYLPTYLEPETLEYLTKAYPYRARYSYAQSRIGQAREIGVFSRLPFVSQIVSEGLDFAPMGGTVAEQEAYRQKWSKGSLARQQEWVRSYQRLEFTTSRGKVSLVPVHFSQPWALIREVDGSLTVGTEMLLANNHPIANQIVRVMDLLAKDLGPSWWKSSVVILGDFNLPRRIYGVEPAALTVFNQWTRDALYWRKSFSFPAISDPDSQSVPPFRIDQAWGTPSTRVEDAEVLQIRGSDHYPIWVSIEK